MGSSTAGRTPDESVSSVASSPGRSSAIVTSIGGAPVSSGVVTISGPRPMGPTSTTVPFPSMLAISPGRSSAARGLHPDATTISAIVALPRRPSRSARSSVPMAAAWG